MLVADRDTAEPLLCHHEQGLLHRRLGRDQGQLRLAVHQVGDGDQHGPDPSTRVQHAEVVGGEPLALQQRDGEGVAQRHLQRSGGRGRADLGGGLRRMRQQQADIRGAAQ